MTGGDLRHRQADCSQIASYADLRTVYGAAPASPGWNGPPKMASHARTPVPAGSGSSPMPPGKRPGGGTILTLASGVLAGVGVYVSTHSVLITLVAASAAIVLAAMVLFPPRVLGRPPLSGAISQATPPRPPGPPRRPFFD
jgi:hypothetical protein